MLLNRRKLLQLTGTSFLVSSCNFLKDFSIPESESDEQILSGYRVGEAFTNADAGIHIGSKSLNTRIKLENEIHSVAYSSKHNTKFFLSKLELYSYAQRGDGPYIPIKAEAGNYFYGHGAVDIKRDVIYTSQAEKPASRDDTMKSNKDGYIYAYSLKDFSLVEKFPSFGKDPHDLKIVGNELLVCNGGANSNVAFINLDTKKLIHSHAIELDHISLRHCEMVDHENFLIASLSTDLNRPCHLYNLNRKTGLKAFEPPPSVSMTLMRAQLLSVLYYDGYVYTTCPFMDNLMVWKLSGEFIGAQDLTAACNLSISKKYKGVIVGSGDDNEVARLIKIENGMIKATKIDWAKGITGAHSLIV